MKHLLGLFTVCLMIGLLFNTANAWYPTTVLEEMGTSVTCGYCPLAYEGIENNQSWFDATEFCAVRFYGAPLYNTTETDDRIAYYPLTPYPTAMFMGQESLVGTDDETASGLPYKAYIEDLLGQPSYFKMTVNSFDLTGPDGLIDLDVEVMEDGCDITNVEVQVLVVEDALFYHYDHNDVVRDILAVTPLTINTTGATQNVTLPFTIDAEWVDANLQLVAFIQDSATKQVYQSVTSDPKPDYAMGYFSTGEHQVVMPLYGQKIYDDFTVYNTGTMTDTYTAELVHLDGNTDWYYSICDHSQCYDQSHTFSLNPGEHIEFHVDITSVSHGYLQFGLKLTQAGWPVDKYRMIHYGYATNSIEVLLVNSDKEEVYNDYYTTALEENDILFGTWNTRFDEPPALLDPLSTPIVVWNNGKNRGGLTATSRDFISNHLDNGGRVLMSGQNLGQEMDNLGGEAYTWYQNYMHAEFIGDSSEDTTVDGVFLDPVSRGMSLNLAGGDGADNQNSMDKIAAADGLTTVVWTYDASNNAALRSETEIYRMIYMAFGFEAIDSGLYRRLVMHNAIDWLRNGDSSVDNSNQFLAELRAGSLIRGNHQIQFTLPTTGQARLSVYGIDGRLVRTLINDELTAGTHTATWNREDNSGQVSPAGVYYYLFETGRDQVSSKAILLK